MIYVSLKLFLYGDLIVRPLFWRDLSGALRYWYFNPDLYARCVMKNTVNDKQRKILWHVDDLKILHTSLTVVDGVISLLTTKYGNVSPLSLS